MSDERTEMTEVYCRVCMVTFGMTRRFRRVRVKDGKTFSCPNGHAISFGTSEAADEETDRVEELEQRLAEMADELEEARDEAVRERARADQLQAQLEKPNLDPQG